MTELSGPLIVEGCYSLVTICPNCERPVALPFTVAPRRDAERDYLTLRVRLAARGRPHRCAIPDPAQLALIEATA